MDDWLVSVEKDGKIVELYYSENLHDIDTIRAIHKGCRIESMQVAENVSTKIENAKTKIDKKKYDMRNMSKRVRCVETGNVYDSVLDCSNALGIPRCSVYKAIYRGIAASGLHFDYID